MNTEHRGARCVGVCLARNEHAITAKLQRCCATRVLLRYRVAFDGFTRSFSPLRALIGEPALAQHQMKAQTRNESRSGVRDVGVCSFWWRRPIVPSRDRRLEGANIMIGPDRLAFDHCDLRREPVRRRVQWIDRRPDGPVARYRGRGRRRIAPAGTAGNVSTGSGGSSTVPPDPERRRPHAGAASHLARVPDTVRDLLNDTTLKVDDVPGESDDLSNNAFPFRQPTAIGTLDAANLQVAAEALAKNMSRSCRRSCRARPRARPRRRAARACSSRPSARRRSAAR